MHTLKEFASFAPAFIAVVMVLQFVIERTFTARDLHRSRKAKLQRQAVREAERARARVKVPAPRSAPASSPKRCIHS